MSNNPEKIECSCGNIMTFIWFIEHERDRNNIKTGRERFAVSHLECCCCGRIECVDDSFDKTWH